MEAHVDTHNTPEATVNILPSLQSDSPDIALDNSLAPLDAIIVFPFPLFSSNSAVEVHIGAFEAFKNTEHLTSTSTSSTAQSNSDCETLV